MQSLSCGMAFPRVVGFEEVGQGNRKRHRTAGGYPHRGGNVRGDDHELDRTLWIVLGAVLDKDRLEHVRVEVKPSRR